MFKYINLKLESRRAKEKAYSIKSNLLLAIFINRLDIRGNLSTITIILDSNRNVSKVN